MRHWTRAPSANQVRLWLGNLQQKRGEWLASIDSWILVAPSFNKIAEVREGLRSSFTNLLKDDQLDAADRTDQARKAASYFEQAATSNRNGPNSWTDLSRQAMTDAAAFRLLYTRDSPSTILRALQSAFASANQPARWAATTQSMLGLAEGLSRNATAARALFARVDWSLAENGIEIIARLDQECRENPPAAKTISNITLELKQQILDSTQKLTDEQRSQLSRYEAEAYRHQGDPQRAIKIYSILAKQRPTDRAVQQTLATLYAGGDSDRDQKMALEHWRRLTRLSPAGTPDWFHAKLGIAQALAQLGESERAAEVIKLTMALHPDLGNDQTKCAFERLLSEVSN